ncbi:rod shape-determining protein MreC [Ereboglobus sp. PH5-5]|uniref:rod shape-determining protein MreC n=1 Tax=unclassified Ereboglobus TaxID=2626932 RepID=UPI002406A825|nr:MULTISPECIES: rod shape-determining protein MreC [unclassified Ereboglobus]MDF9828314.1 rod shape-determining protein MreC [Ereboglobus sp. PH5-10]MDF9834177.1 rod shape-determining protein MreC [Ereboglobus sp. PH5-5]
MQFKRFDQTKPFIVLAIVFAAWMFLPFAAKRLARHAFFEFQAPIDVSAATIRTFQDYWAMRTRNPNDLIEAGQEIARLNSFYENKIREAKTLEGEIARLEALLNLPVFNEYRHEAARVVRRDYNAWWQRITIRKGRNYGITVGSPVIFAGGVVGRVSEVGLYTSVVDLLSSPGVRLSAVIETDGKHRPVNFQGRSSSAFSNATGSLEFVPLDIFIASGEAPRVVTSGLGGVFPPGLSLGVIRKLEPDSDGLFQSAEVSLDSRLASLMEVTVLVPLAPKEPPKGGAR